MGCASVDGQKSPLREGGSKMVGGLYPNDVFGELAARDEKARDLGTVRGP